jgi:hypothetical protein
MNRAPFIDPDRRPHRLAVGAHLAGQAAQPVGIRRDRGHLDGGAILVQQAHVQPLSTEIQPCVQHDDQGLP